MNKLERQRQFERALKQELCVAIETEVVGERMDAMLVGRIKLVAREILLRNGLGKAKIQVETLPAGFSVRVFLPTQGRRVKVIQLTIGESSAFS